MRVTVSRQRGRAQLTEKFPQLVPRLGEGVLTCAADGAEGSSSCGHLRLLVRSSSPDSSLRPAAPSRQTSLLGLRHDADYPALPDLKCGLNGTGDMREHDPFSVQHMNALVRRGGASVFVSVFHQS